MLHKFALAYFDWGWIIATLLGMICGWSSTYAKNQDRTLFMWLVLFACVGGLALIGLHCAT